MGACASVTKAMRGKADDDKAPLPEPAVDLPEVTAGEGDKVEKTIESDKVVVVDDQTPNKVIFLSDWSFINLFVSLGV